MACDDCPVCHEHIQDCDSITTQCKHAYHVDCLSKWVDTGAITCPLCRYVIFSDDAMSYKLKNNRLHYNVFVLWCIQRKLKKKLLFPDTNRIYLFLTSSSNVLQNELKGIWKMSDSELMDQLVRVISNITNMDNCMTMDDLKNKGIACLPEIPKNLERDSISRVLNIILNWNEMN